MHDLSSVRDSRARYYLMYILAMLIFGTNGLVVARLSIGASQIVLLRTVIGGILLTGVVALSGGFDRTAVRAEAPLLLLGGTALGFNWVALFYASVIFFNKKILRTGGLQTAAIELDVAALVVLVYVLLTAGLPHPVKSDLPYLAVMGITNTGLAYLLYFSGLQKLPGQSVALISYIDPVSALLLSAAFLHESMTPVQILGAVLILGGAMWGETRKREAPGG